MKKIDKIYDEFDFLNANKVILNTIKRLKLINCFFTEQVQCSDIYFQQIKVEHLDEIIENTMTQRLAKFILNKKESLMTTEKFEDIEYKKIECIVFSKPEITTIVEAVIQELSDEKINNIRNKK
jgi:hypothetical protein